MQSSFVIVYLIASLLGLKEKNNTPALPAVTTTFIGSDYTEIGLNAALIEKAKTEKKAVQFTLGKSRQQKPVEAWFFPGTSDKNALVIGGVHGSELSSIAVARALIQQLQENPSLHYNVIIVPSLFPDNATKALCEPAHIGSTHNIGRYSLTNSVDPNRQMPSPGCAYDHKTATDHLGRKIELENQFLLYLIQTFRPQRILNIHAIRNEDFGGIYADPRTDHKGIALGYESDSSLAISIAEYISRRGGNVNGNNLDETPTALYYKDPIPAQAGMPQKRNTVGAALKNNRGSGISLGTWASTAVVNSKDPSLNRDAIRIITMEYPGYKRPSDYLSGGDQLFQTRQIQIFAASIREVFLGNFFAEGEVMLIAKQ